MIRTEPYGDNYIKTYSDAGFKIQRDGKMFVTAIDPIGSDREYTETNIPVRVPEEQGGDE